MNKILATVIIFLAGAACALILTHGSLQAQGEGDIMAKLNEIANAQRDISSAINAMKQDIQIIKIRVTQIQ